MGDKGEDNMHDLGDRCNLFLPSELTKLTAYEDEKVAAIRTQTAEIEKQCAKLDAKIKKEFDEYGEMVYQKMKHDFAMKDLENMKTKLIQKKLRNSDHLVNVNKEADAVKDCLSMEREDYLEMKQQMDSTLGAVGLAKKADALTQHPMSTIAAIEKEDEYLKVRIAGKTKMLKEANEVMRTKLQIFEKLHIMDIEAKIKETKESIKADKKELQKIECETKKVKQQIEEKKTQAAARDAEKASDRAKVDSLTKKLDDLRLVKCSNASDHVKQLNILQELKAKEATLNRNSAQKQADHGKKAAQLLEQNVHLKTSIALLNKELALKTEAVEKLRKRHEELKELCRENDRQEIEKQMEKAEGNLRKLQEENINLEASLLELELERQPENNTENRNPINVQAWLGNVRSPFGNTDQNSQEDEDNPDCEVSSTYQG